MKKWLPIILGMGLVCRLALLCLLAWQQFPVLNKFIFARDVLGYTQLAENLLNEGVFRFNFGSPTAYRMPGYPLFMALIFGATHLWLAVQLVQVLIDVFTIWLIVRTTQHITHSTAISLFAGALFALNPFLIYSSICLLPETIVIMLSALSLWIMVCRPGSPWTKITLPLVLMTGVYFKPTILLAAVVAEAAWLLYRWNKTRSVARCCTAAAASLAVGLLLLSPWIVRNYLAFGEFIPLTTSAGSNLYGGNNALADGGYVSKEPYVLENMSETASDRVYTARALEWIQSNPGRFAALLPLKTFNFFWPLALGSTTSLHIPAAAGYAAALWTVLLAFLALTACAVLIIRKKYWLCVAFAAVPFVLLISTWVTFGASRFSYPAYPQFTILIALGMGYWLAGSGLRKEKLMLEG